ncbi:MAG: DEAD/DEAH box helicase [candidate division KSB1 bacterium]|nr:DEAD/DEAH box helicase [candidate division KSB1 bacterium]MDZ7274828.1 DEAD/DEAH box helicase [candidate division KSB1 bacterium]MDZ7288195.1 DEAD/DEAH box helicase [candidate division KSB1 bacterium]MDZ7300424.1 DEAD/DEAH box helicase [candidate division KSB1 bacterium]MDZ7308121.1 DEAD/DEAH box helicase [candidate division KSB1 bacterium]
MSFHRFGLHADLLKALDQLGYHEPTPIQEQAIPLALRGRDLIGCAQTGTGKTAAFALPILNRLHPILSGRIRALILTPTRELAAQINEVMQGLMQYTKLYTAAIYGGVGLAPQQRALRLATDVIVATPGRLLDHMKSGVGRFDGLEVLVLDEADRMLDMGFLPDVNRIIARLPPQRQTMMFSATMPREILELSRKILRDPATVQVGRQAAPAAGVSQAAYPVPGHLKTELLLALLQQHEMESVLIFTRTKDRTVRLALRLKDSGFQAAMIHGDRTQGQRLAALAGFRDRVYRILVATDIAARGLDIDGISHVINFDVPVTPEDYVHRIGRTARAQAVGEALTLVTPAEENALAAIQHLIKVKIPRHTLADFDYSRPSSATAEPRERRPRSFHARVPARRHGGPAAGRTRSRRFAFN